MAMKSLGPALTVVLVSTLLTVQCATVSTGPASCESIEIRSDELTANEAEAYCHYAVEERKKVAEYWGPTWSEPIRIHVSSAYRISRALVPAHQGNRGFMEMPLRRVRDNSGSLLHEIVHIYAPNGNRFLAEGLAVYLHTRLASNPAFPNFGEDLGGSAARSVWGMRSLTALNDVRTPEPLGSIMEERRAYIIAGSFVKFLIENRGLARFRDLYETTDYAKAYGQSLATLEQAWRASLADGRRSSVDMAPGRSSATP